MIDANPEDVGLCPTRLARVGAWADRLVADGKLAGVTTMVARRGKVVHLHCTGLADLERGTAMAPDTIFRIYSMTKPLTSVAMLMLYEEGRFQLDDPISRFLPYFANMRVMSGGQRGKIETVPATRDITFRDLMTHTSGLTYGFMESTLVDAMYREQKIGFQGMPGTLGEMVERLAGIPLIAQPGTAWNYSHSTDVLGHLVAVVSGQSLESFLAERVLGPLGMVDTGFHVPEASQPRFAANYSRGKDGKLLLIDDPQASPYLAERQMASGGGGLVSTAADYMRFCQFMLNMGELDGTRLLGVKTVELMTSNHLGGDMASMGQARFSESTYEGIGFGLGFSVMLDPARAQIIGTPGEYAWGGAASTAFWVDPEEEMAVILLTQLMPSSTYPIRRELRVLTYQAIVE
ncbi:CubicO group peptidase (beta-lactamase class C family) [Humitalea rosea]|uniref:CubicO group peptidase (Beta-lactamase class C family) n=1 Tax=Humitalea rosea TaxID=990373 RepID=A0A2W7IW30_9PROT|nr:serine hydrolase domain-containing protein [Humitalea rosea]PZW50968.1 CubicO group peptidase (beta-lactamase class C family) [Humitalea rosea]